ncbi:MAG TPA: hypothetical protein VKX46_04545 [Ktedonobacteraceae bacterium]|nr:hypothetical protein [Ktedonobacteraceae bacterium]
MAEFTRFPMAREHVITAGTTAIAVIPDIGLVSHFQVGEWPVLYRAAETGNLSRWGLPLMIPNFSYVEDGIFLDKGTTLPHHGFGRKLPWTVIEQQPDSISIQLTSSDATRPSYPYEFAFTARVTASEGTLTYTLTMENRSDEVMPVAPGFHPYFTIEQQDKPALLVEGVDGFTVSKVDWDNDPPNEPYPFHHHAQITIPHRGTVSIDELPVDGAFLLTAMQVWSEPVSMPDHSFVCFEPIVATANGLNRPHDRLNIPPHTTRTIILQLTTRPL